MSEFRRVATCAERLQEAMDIRKKKQVDLAAETGINKSSISRYLSGEMEPKNKQTYKLAKALDVSEQWLWGYDISIERPQNQKRSDAISDITLRLMQDEDFLDTVKKLTDDAILYNLVEKVCSLDEDKRRSLSTLL